MVEAVSAIPAGEFSDTLSAILAPQSAAAFTHPHPESVDKHPSVRYDFAIDQSHSSWHLAVDNAPSSPSCTPAYSGKIWLDKKTGQVLRIEMSTHSLPSGFPLSSSESHIDYDFVKMGNTKYPLPTHAVATMCERDTSRCLINENLFRNYDKFTASSSITFGVPEK
jgi:hypothetical protein